MKNDDIMNEIIDIFYRNKKRYGYRRITLELRNRGFSVNHKKVKRLMTLMGLYGLQPKAKYKSYQGDLNGTVKSQLLDKVVDEENNKTYYERNFETTSCNQKWTTDVSEFHIAAGKLYLSPIMDMHNREIVSYNISTSPNFEQTKDMLNKAFSRFPDVNGLIFHSDQGWQYQHKYFRRTLKEHGIIQSMSRKGNCYDNSVMETFFGRLKTEIYYGSEKEYSSFNAFAVAIEEYINYYNNKRIQAKTKWMPPVKYREASMCLG